MLYHKILCNIICHRNGGIIMMKRKVMAALLSMAVMMSSCFTGNTAYAAKKKVPVKSISVQKIPYGMLTLKKGKTFKIGVSVSPKNASDKKVKFKSSNKKIVSVTSKGVLKAVKTGKCSITVTSSNKKVKKTVKVTVGTPVSSVSLNKEVLNMNTGESFTLKGTVKPAKASNKTVKYRTSDKKIATVNSKGTVKALKDGIAMIYGESADGSNKVSKCVVYISKSDTKPDNNVLPDTSVAEDKDKDEEGKDSSVSVVKGEEDNLSEVDAENIVIGFAGGDCMGSVTQDIELPVKGTYGSKISWKSSDTSAIDSYGNVARADVTKKVVMTASVSNGTFTSKRTFELTVVKEESDISDNVDNTIQDIAKMNGVTVSDIDSGTDAEGYLNSLDAKYSNVKVNSAGTALKTLNNIKSATGIKDAEEELVPCNAVSDDTGSIYKFQQVYDGYDVYGGTVTVSADKDGNADYFISDYSHMTGSLNEDVMSKNEIQNKLDGYGTMNVNEVEDKPVCYKNDDGSARLGYVAYVNLCNDEEAIDSDNVVSEYEVLTDAVTGEIVSANAAQCSAYECKDIVVEGKDLLDNKRKFHLLNSKKNEYILKDIGKNLSVLRGSGNPNKQANPGSTLWRKKTTGWTREEVSAASNAKEAYNYFNDKFGYKSFDGNNSAFNVQIKTGIENNASWSYRLNAILLGNGSSRSAKYKKMSLGADLDLVGHEYTHGVVGSLTELDGLYFGTPGTINEAYADIFGCFIESNWKNKNDWKMGESVTKGKCIRNIANPEEMGNPSKIGGKYYINYKTNDWKNSKSNDRCGVHRNSTIISHAAYLMSKKGISESTLEKLWYKSLAIGYSRYSDFYDVRKNVLTAAKYLNLGNDVINKIKQAFNEVGITKKTCDMNDDYFKALEKANTNLVTGSSSADETDCYVLGCIRETAASTDGDGNALEKAADVNLYEFDPDTHEVADAPFADAEYSPLYGGSFTAYSPNGFSPFVLEISCDGYETQRYYEADLTYGNSVSYESLCLSKKGPDGSAEGTIFNAETHDAIGNVNIRFYKGQENREYTEPVAETVSDADGKYSISLPPGVYTGCVDISGYYKEYFRVKIVSEEKTEQQNCYAVQNKNDGSMAVSYVTRGNDHRGTDALVLTVQGLKKNKSRIPAGDFYTVSRVYPEEADDEGKFNVFCSGDVISWYSCMITMYTDAGVYRTTSGTFNEDGNWVVGSYNTQTSSVQMIRGMAQ